MNRCLKDYLAPFVILGLIFIVTSGHLYAQSSPDSAVGKTKSIHENWELTVEKANTEKEAGNFPLALSLYLTALDYCDIPKSQQFIRLEIAKIYSLFGNQKLFQEYIIVIEEELEKSSDKSILPFLYLVKANSCLTAFKYKRAYQLTLQALAFFTEEEIKQGEIQALDLITQIYYEQNKLRKAHEAAWQYLEKSIDLNEYRHSVKAYAHLSKNYARFNNEDSSYLMINEAMQLCNSYHLLFEKIKIYQILFQNNERWGNDKNALVYYQKYVTLKDSLLGKNMAKELAEIHSIVSFNKQVELNDQLSLEKADTEKQLTASRNARTIYLIGLIAIVLLVVVVIHFLLKARKANKKLIELAHETRENRDKVLDAQVELIDSNKKLLNIQSALMEQKEKAERASRAKDTFLSSVSHELRTPLTAIIGLTEDTIPQLTDGITRENLDVIKFSGESLLQLVNEILDFNKIQSGKVELENISFNFKDYFNKMIKALKPRARANQVNLIYKFPKDIPDYFIADPVRLGQVVNNLLSNAIKFTENGNIEFEISLVSKGLNSYQLRFAIKDEGIGIPQDKLQAIFNRFEQASVDTTRKYGGTGLGLAISKRIIELYGSTIQVKSEIGKGSVFYFLITVKEGKIPAEVAPLAWSDIPTEINILLVEDNKVNQKLVSRTFANIDIEIDTVSNGKEAIERLEMGVVEYDLILMDIHMPLMDGLEATKIIRTMDGYFRNVPIIGLSGSVIKEEKELKQLGLTAYMQKPFKRDELLKLVAEQIVKN